MCFLIECVKLKNREQHVVSGEDEQRNRANIHWQADGAKWSLRRRARVMELADMQDLGSCAERCGGSSPFSRTKPRLLEPRYHRRRVRVCRVFLGYPIL